MKNLIEKINTILNDDSFDNELRNGLNNSMNELLDKAKVEKLYCVGLFTSGEYSYLELTANTIEGLEEKAKEYKSNEYYKEASIDELAQVLKWSPCDWKYHCSISEEHFFNLNKKLEELRGISDGSIDLAESMDEALELIDKKIIQPLNKRFIDALQNIITQKDLNAKGIVAGIWMGDQSEEERIYFVSKLNTSKLSDQFITESAKGFQISEEMYRKRIQNDL